MQSNARTHFIGNLTADPKMTVSNGREMVHVTVAVATRSKKKPPEEGFLTNYYEVTYAGSGYKFLADVLQKGSQVFVDGDLVISTYEKDGVERVANRVYADELVALNKLKPRKEQKPDSILDAEIE